MLTDYEAALMSFLAYEIEEAEKFYFRRAPMHSPEYMLRRTHPFRRDLKCLFGDLLASPHNNFSTRHLFSHYLADQGWGILKTFNYDIWLGGSFCGYQGIAFVNPGKKEIVIAHRGTIHHSENFKADIEILKGSKGQPPSIISGAIMFVAKIVHLRNSELRGYRISQTGHSLGGFLAEFAAAYIADPKPVMDEWAREQQGIGIHYLTIPRPEDANAITFESLGSANMLIKFGIMHNNAQRIINYLAPPNIANTANPHIGELRLLTSSHGTPPVLSGFRELNVDADIQEMVTEDFQALMNDYNQHQLLRIIEQNFNPQTKEPFFKRVVSWPRARNAFSSPTPYPSIPTITSDWDWKSGLVLFAITSYAHAQFGGVTKLRHVMEGSVEYAIEPAVSAGVAVSESESARASGGPSSSVVVSSYQPASLARAQGTVHSVAAGAVDLTSTHSIITDGISQLPKRKSG